MGSKLEFLNNELTVSKKVEIKIRESCRRLEEYRAVYSDARKKDQGETWEAFFIIESQFKVEHVHVLRDSDYGNIIKRNWRKGIISYWLNMTSFPQQTR